MSLLHRCQLPCRPLTGETGPVHALRVSNGGVLAAKEESRRACHLSPPDVTHTAAFSLSPVLSLSLGLKISS